MHEELCPCGTGDPYAECCGPYLSGSRLPKTAESLMRARYTAYARGDVTFLEQSLHPKSRDTFDEKATREWASKSEWRGLEVVRTEQGGPDDKEGVVEFVARYKNEGQELEHREVAEFKRDGTEWRFVDGRVFGLDPIVREEAKVGRNDPCPCGSGKKYKKCCAHRAE